MDTTFITPTEYQTDPAKIADLLFSTTLLSKASQTAVFFGQISSLDKIMKENITEPDQLKRQVQEMYEVLFTRYFDKAEVITTIREDKRVGNALVMDISIEYTKDYVKRTFADTIVYLNGKTRKIAEIING